MPRTLILAMLLAAASRTLLAQNPVTDATARIPERLCWRGRPMPECTTFWITEFGVDATMSSTQTRVSQGFGGAQVPPYAVRDFESRLVWTVGPMFNTSPRTAFGGTLSLSPLGRSYRTAVEARRRWWTTGGVTLDLSAGPLRMGAPDRSGAFRDEYGLTAGALIVGADLIEINGRADLLVTGGKARFGTSLGLGGGSWVAAAGSLALGLFVLAVISAGPWD